MTNFWKPLKPLIDDHQQFLLTSHRRPDCDALGSELGLATLLQSLGKQVLIVNTDPAPPRLAFVDPQQRIQVLGRDVESRDLHEIQVLIVVDTGAWGQLGSMADVVRATHARVAVIDHHASDGELNADVVCQDETREATGRMIVELADYLNVPLTPAMAQPLFAAIATDSGWFRFPAVSSETYRIVARLIDAGAVPHQIYRHLYEQDSLGRAKLRGRMLDQLQTARAGRLAYATLQTTDFEHTGAARSDTEDFVNLALAIAGTEVAILFTEQLDGTIKVSFRSNAGVDCSQVAAEFGGGGHRPAAGATITGSLEQVKDRVLAAACAALDRTPPANA